MLKYALLILLILPSVVLSQQTVGLFLNDSLAYNGYTLFSPSSSTTTYLIDNCGRIVNSWSSAYFPGSSVYLLENGNLLRTARIGSTFNAGGTGGRIELYDWDGNLLWEYNHSTNTFHQHHDIEPLPNGNILILAWEKYSQADAIAAGRDPAWVGAQGIWSEQIVEVEPVGTDQINLIWGWRLWDHLIQDFDSTQSNYGVIADHPELLDINYLGHLGVGEDWVHANSIDYHEALDQILISSRHLDEIYIIDHSTTISEAASHSGGNSGKGGDLLFRWGNPEVYGRGLESDQTFFGQHDANWIEDSLLEGSNIMVFNNGLMRPEGAFSSVDVIALPLDSSGSYILEPNQAFGPDTLSWTFVAQPPNSMYSNRISGARRLPNGNTFICDGVSGHFREVTIEGELVWEYISPIRFGGPVSQGNSINQNDVFRATRLGESYAAFVGRDLTPGDPIELNPLPSSCVIYAQQDSLPGDTTTTSLVQLLPWEVQAYPNPFSDHVTIESVIATSSQLSIFDQSGRLILARPIVEPSMMIPTSMWPKGLYLVRIISEKEQLTIKLIKQ